MHVEALQAMRRARGDIRGKEVLRVSCGEHPPPGLLHVEMCQRPREKGGAATTAVRKTASCLIAID